MKRAKGFTLVELLVVIAIISVLIALLLPVLKAVKRQAEKVVCTSNLRQIYTALRTYANDYNGWLPLPSDSSGGSFNPQRGDRRPEDWLHWQPGRDLNSSVIRPYLSDFKVLVCPAGIPQRDPIYIYPFSYSLNHYITGSTHHQGPWELGSTSVNLKHVIQPWHKLLVVEEDSLTINDGSWSCGFLDGGQMGNSTGYLSARHDLKHEYGDKSPAWGYTVGRGHGICADGTYLWVDRYSTRMSHYYTHPRYRGPIQLPPGGWTAKDDAW
jgi:prepilin-type N-terminal cleavage/methylation domain-containing protein